MLVGLQILSIIERRAWFPPPASKTDHLGPSPKVAARTTRSSARTGLTGMPANLTPAREAANTQSYLRLSRDPNVQKLASSKPTAVRLALQSGRRDTGDEGTLEKEVKDQNRQCDDCQIGHNFAPGDVELKEILQPDHDWPVFLRLRHQ